MKLAKSSPAQKRAPRRTAPRRAARGRCQRRARRDQRFEHRLIEGVELLGTVEAHVGDAVLHRHGHALGHGESSSAQTSHLDAASNSVAWFVGTAGYAVRLVPVPFRGHVRRGTTSPHPIDEPARHCPSRTLAGGARAGTPAAARPRGGAAVCVYHRGEKVVDIWGGVKDAAGNPWQADTHVGVVLDHQGRHRRRRCTCSSTAACSTTTTRWRKLLAGVRAATARSTSPSATCSATRPASTASAIMIDDAARMRDWDHMTDALARSRAGHRARDRPARTTAHLRLAGRRGDAARHRPSVRRGRCSASSRSRSSSTASTSARRAEPAARAAELLVPDSGRRRMAGLGSALRRAQRVFSVLRLPVDLRRIADALMPPGIETFEWAAPETLAAADSRRQRPLHRALARQALRDARQRRRVQRHAPALRGDAGARHRGADAPHRSGRAVPDALAARLPPRRHHAPGRRRARFGHFGFGGSGAWADPDRKLSMAMVLNSGIGTPFGDLRTFRIGGRVLRCAERRRGVNSSASRAGRQRRAGPRPR